MPPTIAEEEEGNREAGGRASRAWPAARPLFPRLLRRLVLPAALRFLRRAAPGELSAPEQYRCRQTRARNLEAARHPPARGVAGGEDRLPRRLRFLPLEDAALV